MLSLPYLDVERVLIVADVGHGGHVGITASRLSETVVATLRASLSPGREVRTAAWGSPDLLDPGALVVAIQASAGTGSEGDVPVALSLGIWRAGLRSEDMPLAGNPPAALIIPAAGGEAPLTKAISDLAERVVAGPLSGVPPR